MNNQQVLQFLALILPLLSACGASPDETDISARALRSARLSPGSGPGLFIDQRNGFECRFSAPDDTCRPLPCFEASAGRAAKNPATGLYERMVVVAKGKPLPRFGNWGDAIPTGCSISGAWPFRLDLTPVTEALNWPATYPMTPMQLAAFDFYRANYEGCVDDSAKPEWCVGATSKDLPPNCTTTGCLTTPTGF